MQCSDICDFAPYFFEGNFIGGNFILYFGYILLVQTRLITYQYQHIILELQIWLQKMW
jgi:hypothetical protein